MSQDAVWVSALSFLFLQTKEAGAAICASRYLQHICRMSIICVPFQPLDFASVTTV